MAGQRICVGQVSGVFGVKGWIKVIAYTAKKANIIEFNPWFLRHQDEFLAHEVADGSSQGKKIIAKLAAVNSREDAALLIGRKIYIGRAQLPSLQTGEYYWTDLVGLSVLTVSGFELGTVDYLIETGANDVLVVKGDRERLIPFVRGDTIKKIDMEAGQIVVDWDGDF